MLADASGVRVNLLHLSSEEALRATREVRALYPEIDIRAETTLHHLCLTYDMLEGKGLGGKVNPPIRTRRDVDALWDAVCHGAINWVASDHACCLEELKQDELWTALPGFGGTALLYPLLISEGYHKRKLSLEQVAEPGVHEPRSCVRIDPSQGRDLRGRRRRPHHHRSREGAAGDRGAAALGAGPHAFAGMPVKGWPVLTMLRGVTVFKDGEIIGGPTGEFLSRPLSERRVPVSV